MPDKEDQTPKLNPLQKLKTGVDALRHAGSPAPALSLPQHDDKPQRRARDLAGQREAYPYTYDKPNVRGLAMCADPPPTVIPHPGWVAQAAKVVSEIAANIAAVRGEEEAEQSKRQRLADITGTIRGAGSAGPEALLDLTAEIASSGNQAGRPNNMGHYSELYRTFQLPDVALEALLDSTFARMRVAGVNPAWIRQVDPDDGLPDDFGVTAAHYQSVTGDSDSLQAALTEGRLFLCEYRELLDLQPGGYPVPDKIRLKYTDDREAWDAAYKEREASYADCDHRKHLTAPLALFAVPVGSGSLTPVAIQLFPNGHNGQTYDVVTPADGAAWTAAKTWVNIADANLHEAVSHLGLTHLVQEAFCLALHNCLAPQHPLYRLLSPHFEGTFLINAAADAALVSTGGSVDKLLNSTIGGIVSMTANAVTAFNFNEAIFPRQLERRGVADADVLQDYPYRDDGLLVWGAMTDWVRAYVEHYYASDEDVVADSELQDFVRQVGQQPSEDASGRMVGGKIGGVGEDGPQVLTRGYLVQMVTQIIWNGSAQHAAVNFPQGDLMATVPLYPLGSMGPPVSGVQGPDEQFYLDMLPMLDIAQLQIAIVDLLGSIHHTKLGGYGYGLPIPWFSDATIQGHLEDYQRALQAVDDTILERNTRRPSYSYLRPPLIPQSINI